MVKKNSFLTKCMLVTLLVSSIPAQAFNPSDIIVSLKNKFRTANPYVRYGAMGFAALIGYKVLVKPVLKKLLSFKGIAMITAGVIGINYLRKQLEKQLEENRKKNSNISNTNEDNNEDNKDVVEIKRDSKSKIKTEQKTGKKTRDSKKSYAKNLTDFDMPTELYDDKDDSKQDLGSVRKIQVHPAKPIQSKQKIKQPVKQLVQKVQRKRPVRAPKTKKVVKIQKIVARPKTVKKSGIVRRRTGMGRRRHKFSSNISNNISNNKRGQKVRGRVISGRRVVRRAHQKIAPRRKIVTRGRSSRKYQAKPQAKRGKVQARKGGQQRRSRVTKKTTRRKNGVKQAPKRQLQSTQSTQSQPKQLPKKPKIQEPKVQLQVQQKRELKECPICCEDRNKEDFVRLDCGCNDCCKTCLNRLINNVAIKDQSTNNLLCPNCRRKIGNQDILKIIGNDRDKLNKIEKIQLKEWSIKQPGYLHCPSPDCEGFVINDQKLPRVTCPQGHSYCGLCGEGHSDGISCQEFRRNKNLGGKKDQDRKNQQWIRNNTKACPGCNAPIQKNEGCNHMTCKCGHEFCWLCNQPYSGTNRDGIMNCGCRLQNNNIDQDQYEYHFEGFNF